ncbi:hypothetical protein EMCG_06253 [[Emmonsia] crescens]|uniref:Uncharacterized protein n=1 Tax=[Emmonsia] crescens TaxID=73230 RepID=A0A0G2IBZ0_9EURO|nr:hypothetical protein EMCG_06253 [Emmonsia crescens UAMH 3008]
MTNFGISKVAVMSYREKTRPNTNANDFIGSNVTPARSQAGSREQGPHAPLVIIVCNTALELTLHTA